MEHNVRDQLIEQFKTYLSEGKGASSPITVKNYLADLKSFISWFEKFYGQNFEPQLVTKEVIEAYKTRSSTSPLSSRAVARDPHMISNSGDFSSAERDRNENPLSPRTLERHFSSLRKFFTFCESKELVEKSPFTLSPTSSPSSVDNWDLKEFKNYLYVGKSSDLTIKNYLIDLQAFKKWCEETLVGKDSYVVDQDVLSKVDSKAIEEYRDRLLHVLKLSPKTVNRKLSSLRKFFEFRNSTAIVRGSHETFGFKNIAHVIQDVDETGTVSLEEAQNITEKLSADKTRSYSRFAPFRLFQKLFTPYHAAEGKIAHKIAHAFRKSNLGKRKPIKDALSERDLSPNSEAALAHSSAKHGQGSSSPKISFDQAVLATKHLPKEFYAPHAISLLHLPFHKKLFHHLRFTRPTWYKNYHSSSFSHYLHFAILVIYCAIIGTVMYQGLFGNDRKSTFAAPTAPPRILSFQGRLTDNSDNPITSPTDLRFGIYNSVSASGSALLWQEVQYQVIPDSDGIFAVQLGTNTVIPQNVFGDNSSLYLGVTVTTTPELTPRQRLAAVAYATNAELLQGMAPITQSGAGTSNVVLALDSTGNLTIGGTANPTFQASGGQFKISGQPLLLTTNVGSAGNITIAPDGLGVVDIQKPIQNTTLNGNILPGTVEINDRFGVLATDSANAAFIVNNNTAGGDIIAASSSGTTKFRLTNSGNLQIVAGGAIDANTAGTLSIGGTTQTGLTIGHAGAATSLLGSNFTAGGVAYGASNTLSFTAAGSATQCLLGGTTPSWGSCATGASAIDVFWNQTNGAVYPNNSTVDFLIGGQATTSAKFAVLNINTGTPVASVSSGLNGNSSYLTADGTLATQNRQTLTIGNSSTYNTTGNVLINPNGTGNVGIGSTLPITKLDVAGGIWTSGGLFVSDSNLPTTNAAPAYGIGISNLNVGGGASPAVQVGGYFGLNFQTSSGQAVFTQAGNLGIGSTAPAQKLEIVGGNVGIGNNQEFAAKDSAGTYNGFLHMNASNEWVLQQSVANGTVRFTTNGGSGKFVFSQQGGVDLITLLNNGNLGIGSTSPATVLDVQGTNGKGNALAIFNQTQTGANADILTGSASGSTKFVFNKNGNLGIGSTIPGAVIDIDNTNIGGIGIQSKVANANSDIAGRFYSAAVTPSSDIFQVKSTAVSGTGFNLLAAYTGAAANGTAGTAVFTLRGDGQITDTAFTTNGGLLYTNASGVFAQTGAGTSSQCLLGGTTPTFGSCGAATSDVFWNQTNGAVYPNNSTVDLLIGGQATTSAKFGFINNNTGSPTATISGNLSLVVPTTAGANTFNYLNNSSLNFQRSVGGDAGLTSTLFLGANGNVGIGSTSPAAPLHVKGGTSYQGIIRADSNALDTYTSFGLYENGAKKWSLYNHPSTTPADSLIFSSATDADLLTLTQTGNVGIGTTSPVNKLELAVSTAATGGIGFGTDTNLYRSAANSLRTNDTLYADGGFVYQGADYSNGLQLSNTLTASSVRSPNLLFSDNQATPQNIYLRKDGAALIAIGTDGTTTRFQFGADASTASYFNGGNVGIGTTSPAEKLDILTGNINLSNGYQLTWGSTMSILGNLTSNFLSFKTNNSEKVRIDSSGNVGIGSTAPAAKLDVVGQVVTSDYAFLGGTTSTGLRIKGADTSNTIWQSGGALSITTNTYNLNLGARGASVYDVTLAGGTGYLGIGTTAPASVLDVQGTNGKGNALAIFNQTQTGTNADIFTASASGATKFVITNGGNVGIGTTLPSQLLQVNTGNIYANGGDIIINQGAKLSLNGGGTSYFTMPATNTVSLFTASAERMRIDANGNLGIGTTTPASVLDVQGTYGKGNALAIFNQTQTGTNADILTASASGATKFVITNTGNVGIGTTLPGGILHVASNSNKALRITNATGTNAINISGTNAVDTSVPSIRSDGANVVYNANTAGALYLNYDAGLGTIFGNGGALAVAQVNSAGNATFGSGSDLASTTYALYANGAFRATGQTTLSNYTTNGGLLYTNASGVVAQTTAGTSSQCLLGGTTPTFGSCGAATSDVFWNQANGALFANNSTVDLLIGGQATTSANFAVLNNNSGTPTASAAGNFIVMPKTSGSSQLGGNVGIGTTAPVNKFEIAMPLADPATSGSAANGYARLVDNTGGAGSRVLDFGVGSANAWLQSRDKNTYAVNYGLLLNPNGGNVGIGTTAPSLARVQIEGGSTPGLFVTGASPTTRLRSAVTRYRSDFDVSSGGVTWNSYDDTGATYMPMFLQGQYQAFSTGTTGSLTEVMRITGGNVGIGSTAPAAKLDLNGSSATTPTLQITSGNTTGTTTNSGVNISLASTSGYGIYSVANSLTSGLNMYSYSTKNTTAGGDATANQFQLAAAPTSASTSNFSALMGYVNTSSLNVNGSMAGLYGFSQLLHTSGTVATSIGVRAYTELDAAGTVTWMRALQASYGLIAGTITNGTGLYVGNPGSGGGTLATNYGIYLENQTTGSTNYAIYSAGGKSYFAGNVGIGTTVPGAMLDVNGNINASAFVDRDNTAYFLDQAATGTSLAVAGNVGVGTTAPGVRLQVQGANVAASTPGTDEIFKLTRPISSGLSYPQAASLALGTYSSNGAGNTYGPDTRLDFKLKSTSVDDFTTDVTVMTLQDNGNVGIGTTAPVEKLQVSGNVLISAQTNAGGTVADWNKITQATAGTIASAGTALIDGATTSVVYNGSLYVGTQKANAAEVYRFDGSTWTKVSQATAGTIASAGTANIDGVTAMAVHNGYLYIGTNEAGSAEVYQYNGGTTWTKVSQTTAGTIASAGTAAINGVDSMVVYNGQLYIGTQKTDSAEVYRFDGATTWTLVSGTGSFGNSTTLIDYAATLAVWNGNMYLGTRELNASQLIRYDGGTNWSRLNLTPGTFITTGNIDGINSMAVYNGYLYFGTFEASSAEVYRLEGVQPVGALSGQPITYYGQFNRVSQTTAGTIASGGTATIDSVRSMSIYNGSLYVGTEKANAAEVLQYNSNGTNWTKVTNATAGTIGSATTANIDIVRTLQAYNGLLFAGTYEPSGAEGYTFSSVEGKSFALKFNAASNNAGGEQNSILNVGEIAFAAEQQAGANAGNANTGSFQFSHRISTTTGAYDLAEDYPTRDETVAPGDIVATDTKEATFVKKSAGTQDPGILGVYSLNPALRLSQKGATINGAKAIPVALVGRVPVNVSSVNGPILIGDAVTSSRISGYGMKATEPGQIVGKALEQFDPSKGKGVQIPCPNGAPEGVICGKIMLFVSTGYYDPQILLTESGDISIFALGLDGLPMTSSPSATTSFGVFDAAGNALKRIGIFREGVFASIRAGMINATKISTDTLSVTTDSVSIAGVSLRDFIIITVRNSNLALGNGSVIKSPVGSIGRLNTNIISPLGSDVTISLGDQSASKSAGTLRIKNTASQEVASINSEGDATFSGRLTSANVYTNDASISGTLSTNVLNSSDASISGTLRANRIIADQIEGLDGKIASFSAGRIASSYSDANASGAALLTQFIVRGSRVSTDFMDAKNLIADFGTFTQGLISMGPSTFGQVSVLDTLSLGTNFTIGNNALNTLGATLEIQPLKQGAISFMAGAVKIGIDGSLEVNENAVFAKNVTVKGTLSANIISPIGNNDLTIKLGNQESGSMNQGQTARNSSFMIHNSSESAVLSVNQLGDIIASGAATISKLNLSLTQPAFALNGNESIATGSAGTAILNITKRELTIKNSLVTAQSLIYITPVGDTNNQVIYLLRQVAHNSSLNGAEGQGSFTVGVSAPALQDIQFNWIIVN